jgi:hypothetical protein
VLSSNIDDRTPDRLYAWSFGDASVMCSYKMANNSYSYGIVHRATCRRREGP